MSIGNRYVLRRALLGLFAATLGGMAASAGLTHMRSLTDAASATTINCSHQHEGSSTAAGMQATPSRHGSTVGCAVGRGTKRHTVGTSGSKHGSQGPVVAVLVPVQGQNKSGSARASKVGVQGNGIFVDPGSVTFGGVTYCERRCPQTATQHQVFVPVTIVDVHYQATKKKTATH